jgi:hypothetical protein
MIVTLNLEKDLLRQSCANCKRERDLTVSELELGVEGGPDVIALPPCECGAREFLTRTWDTVEEVPELVGSPMDLQRRSVNGLAQHLKGLGRSHPSALEAHRAEKAAPRDLPA